MMARIIHRRVADEGGAFIILWALMLVAIMTMLAIVIDLGHVRERRRNNQSVADFAALAAGPYLAGKAGGVVIVNSREACRAAFSSVQANYSSNAALTAATMPCDSLQTKTDCDASPSPLTITTTTSTDPIIVEITYPVPDSAITDAQFTVGENDGTQCERVMVEVTTGTPGFFGGVVGYDGGTARAKAVIHGELGTGSFQIPAFVMLERERCSVIWSSGGFVVVDQATNGQAGVLAVDSHGQEEAGGAYGCNDTTSQNGKVLYATNMPDPNAASKMPAIQIASGSDGPGRIEMYALNQTVIDSVGFDDRSAYCHTLCGAGGPGIDVVPTTGNIVSRKPVDDFYNSAVFADLFPAPWSPTTTGAITGLVSHANEAQSLAAAIATSCATGCAGTYGYTSATTISGPSCSGLADGTVISHDFVYVNCPSAVPSDKGFEPPANLTFSGRDFVFSGAINVGNNKGVSFSNAREIIVRGGSGDSGINVNGGNARFHTNTGAAPNSPPECASRTAAAGAKAGRLVVQTGKISTSGDVRLCQTFVLVAGVAPNTTKVSGGSTLAACSTTFPCPVDLPGPTNAAMTIQGPIDWSAPNQIATKTTQTVSEPFEDLALWAETAATSDIKSNAKVDLVGVFFLPNGQVTFQAPSTLSPRAAQFFARRVELSNGGIRLQPSPNDSIETPAPGTYQLIR